MLIMTRAESDADVKKEVKLIEKEEAIHKKMPEKKIMEKYALMEEGFQDRRHREILLSFGCGGLASFVAVMLAMMAMRSRGALRRVDDIGLEEGESLNQ